MIDQRPPGRTEGDLHALAPTVLAVTERVAQRLIEEIEHDDARRTDGSVAGVGSRGWSDPVFPG